MRPHLLLRAWMISLMVAVVLESRGSEPQLPAIPTTPSNTAESVPDPSAVQAIARPAAAATAHRLREGSKIIDVVGDFQKSIDRMSFFPKDGQSPLRVLENLALERVTRTLEENPTARIWSVTGTITEFRGENYLLITRAILRARPRAGSPPARQPAEAPATTN